MFPTGLNNQKTKEDNSNVHKFKAILVDLKKLSDIISIDVVKEKQFIAS